MTPPPGLNLDDREGLAMIAWAAILAGAREGAYVSQSSIAEAAFENADRFLSELRHQRELAEERRARGK